jgi:hypothetical protein
MPPLTRWYVKLALLYLLAAVAGGVWQAAGGPGWLTPVTVHVFVVGWITGTIFGVAYWMFPKYSKEQPRGPNPLTVGTFILFHSGLLLRIAAEPSGIGPLLILAALCQWVSALGFVVTIWPRIKAR